MNISIKDRFLNLWKKYFKNSELPITFYYSKSDEGAVQVKPPGRRSCLICELSRVREGESLAFNAESVRCGGGKRYLGFTDKVRPGFEYFLSCGNGEIEGERYIRTPEMVSEIVKCHRKLPIPEKNIIFKRWDKLMQEDDPEVAIFFSKPDVLAGLFTLANFDQTEPNTTFSPFGAGCGSIVYYPYMEIKSERPRAVIGMFDPSARPCVPKDVLTFAVPMVKFEKMIGYMEETFLITGTWKTVMDRLD